MCEYGFAKGVDFNTLKNERVQAEGNRQVRRVVTVSPDYPINGRELHEQLMVQSNYTTWFSRMCEYGFTEKVDFEKCFPNLESGSNGGQNKVDHMLTLSMAKEICMIQRSEYFYPLIYPLHDKTL